MNKIFNVVILSNTSGEPLDPICYFNVNKYKSKEECKEAYEKHFHSPVNGDWNNYMGYKVFVYEV